MRRAWMVGVAVVAVLAGVAIGVASYHAGVNHGLTEAGRATQVIRVEDRGGFFPFGFLLFPLFVIGTILLVRGLFWRRRWGGRGWDHRGPGAMGRGEMFEDWHRRQHDEATAAGPGQSGGSGTPAGV